MKRMIALLLCLCFMLGGCTQNQVHTDENAGVKPEPSPAPLADDGSFDELALGLPALPELPREPDESAFWEAMYGKNEEEQNKLWDEFSAQQAAYYEAVRSLRGDGVDESLAGAFETYTLKTARQLFSGDAQKNVVYSPANLYLALCMLCEATDGDTRAQLLSLLGLEDVGQARTASNSLWRTLYNDSATDKTLLANSIWLNEQIDFKQDVVDKLANDYYASTFRSKMGEASTDAAIAAWINENTNYLLENAANGIQTDPDTLMMLISALYFKGTWADQFEDFLTREDVFTTADGKEQKLDFMHQNRRGNFFRGSSSDGLRFTLASLPFCDGASMWFLLPDEGETPDAQAVISELVRLTASHAEADGSGVEAGYGDIRWSLPKFDVDSDLDLIPALKSLGVTDVFAKDAADFSPLTDLDAVVSAIQHAARVKVDEEGCEAAAFTAISVTTTSCLPEKLPVIEMNLNRPFGFLITGTDGLPLFLGMVNTVSKS